MCLTTVYKGKQKRDALAKLPENGYYWKAVCYEHDKYKPQEMVGCDAYKIGWNKTKAIKYEYNSYRIAFHIFRNKKDAEEWRIGYNMFTRKHIKVVRCKVEKKNIVAIGLQSGVKLRYGLVILTTRFWCPKPRRK